MIDLPIIWDLSILRSSIDNTSSLQLDYLSKAEIISVQIAYAIMCFLGTIGNLFTIIAFLRSSDLMNQPTTKFVVSLATSDFLLCLIYMPIVIALYGNPNIIESVCPFYPAWAYGLGGISLITLMAISINKYIMVLHNNIYQKFYTTFNVLLMIVLIWASTFVFLALPLTGVWGKIDLTGSKQCDMLSYKEGGLNPKVVYTCVYIFLSLSIMTFCYTAIFIKMRRLKKEMQEYFSSHDVKDIQVLKMMFILFTCYIISTIPFIIINVVNPSNSPQMHIIPTLLLAAQSVINPFLYAIRNDVYKPAYIKLYQDIRSCCSNHSSVSQSNPVSTQITFTSQTSYKRPHMAP